MNTALALNPMLRQTVGFDRFNDMFEPNFRSDGASNTFPPYNIIKSGEDNYTITMAVPGFSENDLKVVVQRDQLEVSGRVDDQLSDDATYLHRGICNTSFERSFRLAEHMKVTGAEFRDGMLNIQLLRDIPEEARPQMIEIKHVDDDRKGHLSSIGKDTH